MDNILPTVSEKREVFFRISDEKKVLRFESFPVGIPCFCQCLTILHLCTQVVNLVG